MPLNAQALSRLPREIRFVRELEAFEGPILSEYQAVDGGGVYVEKWCAHEQNMSRYLLVRSDQRAVAEYLGGRVALLTLLTVSSDGIGFVVDRAGDTIAAIYVVALESLPPQFLPQATAYHDVSLRPYWETVPQSFLVEEGWNAKRLADIERRYLNIAGFAYFTEPGSHRHLPSGILSYNYDRGYPIASAFNRLRITVPKEERSRSVGVSASSPGVLTIEAPAATANRVEIALRALAGSLKAYESLHAWSKIKPKTAAERMPDLAIARRDLRRLCDVLTVDEGALLTGQQADDPMAVLTAGKLIAAYWRQLWRIRAQEDGAEFISVKVDPATEETHVVLGDDEDEEDDDE